MKKNIKGFFAMKLKNSIKFYLISIILAGICFGKGQIVKAADTAYMELKSNTEYSQYDVTGDGKADKVVIKNEENGQNLTLKVFINDQIALERKEASKCSLLGCEFN